jgi:hypothetical protein
MIVSSVKGMSGVLVSKQEDNVKERKEMHINIKNFISNLNQIITYPYISV